MLIALLACVTEATFTERFAGAHCDLRACNSPEAVDPYDGYDGCVDFYATEEVPDYLVCHDEFPADLAADCIREAEADVDVEHGGACTGDWPSCWAMHCGVT